MVTTVSPDSPATSPAPGPLQLRVRGTRHDGRLVELNAQKCAVGGGRRATLRIAGPALEPVEVLILRGAHGTVAKAWSTSARLNGRRFEAASLSPGDLLAIGPLELEVVACPPPVGLAESPAGGPRFTELLAPPVVASTIPPTSTRPRSGTDRQRSRRLLGALRAARQELGSALTAASAAGSQADHLNDLLQAGQAEVDRLRAEVHCEGQRKSTELSTQEEALAAARAELAAQRIELNALRAELDRRAEDLLHRESGAAGALADRKTELAAREESLGLAQAEMDRLHMEADEHRRQMDAERRLLAQRQAELDERSEALDRHDDQARVRTQELERRAEEVERAAAEHRELAERRQQAGDEQAAFEAQRLAWESQRGEQQARIAEEQQRLIDEAERLEHARRALESERNDWDRERTEVAEAAEAVARIEIGPSEPAATKPAPHRSTEDHPANEQDDEVFARLRALSLLRDSQPAAGLDSDEEPAEAAAAPTRRDPPASAASSRAEVEEAAEEDADDLPPPARAPAAPADDEGEESIQDYMNRLLQRVRGDAPLSQNKPASQAPLRSPTTYRPAPAPQVVAAPAPPVAPPRKSHAPERSSDLLAMRELANLSAQTALDSYAHRRWASAAVGKVIVSVFALVACLTLMAALPGWSTLKIVSGGAALVIAVFWGLQAGILAQQVRAARQRRTPASEAPQAKGHSQLATSEADEPFIPTARPADGENDQLAD